MITAEEIAELRIGDRLCNNKSREYQHETKAYDGALTLFTVVGWFNGKAVACAGACSFAQEVTEEWTLIGRARYDQERLRVARDLGGL